MKDMYIDCLEGIMAGLVENGMDEDEAYDKTGDLAYDLMRDKLADMIDALRQRRKDGYV